MNWRHRFELPKIWRVKWPSRVRIERMYWWALWCLATYIGLFFATTTVRPQGHGGLSGPLHVRVFASEVHVAAFYPVYLVERWIRNDSLTYSAYRFGVDFEDETYAHDWLYGDGKYGMIWYEDQEIALACILGSIAVAILCWKVLHMPWFVSPGLGVLVSLLVVFGYRSKWEVFMWEDAVAIERTQYHQPTLHLQMVDPEGKVKWRRVTPKYNKGGNGYPGEQTFEFKAMEVGVDRFRLSFQTTNAMPSNATMEATFLRGTITETNWHGFLIRGRVREQAIEESPK